MLTTKRYEYLPIGSIKIHHELTNHRLLDGAKVVHLETDIMKNGLLEPLVVWERSAGEYYLVGGFHRMEAITGVRKKNPGFFDRIDVRVVAGDPDEIKALNLKLNADRVDAKINDYFQTVLYLNNAGWQRERIAEFFDKSTSWIDDIIRYAPRVTDELVEKLASGGLSWNRAKSIIQAALDAEPGKEKETIKKALEGGVERKVRPLTFRSALGRLTKAMEMKEVRTFTLDIKDLYALLHTLQGKKIDEEDVRRIKKSVPVLFEE